MLTIYRFFEQVEEQYRTELKEKSALENNYVNLSEELDTFRFQIDELYIDNDAFRLKFIADENKNVEVSKKLHNYEKDLKRVRHYLIKHDGIEAEVIEAYLEEKRSLEEGSEVAGFLDERKRWYMKMIEVEDENQLRDIETSKHNTGYTRCKRDMPVLGEDSRSKEIKSNNCELNPDDDIKVDRFRGTSNVDREKATNQRDLTVNGLKQTEHVRHTENRSFVNNFENLNDNYNHDSPRPVCKSVKVLSSVCKNEHRQRDINDVVEMDVSTDKKSNQLRANIAGQPQMHVLRKNVLRNCPQEKNSKTTNKVNRHGDNQEKHHSGNKLLSLWKRSTRKEDTEKNARRSKRNQDSLVLKTDDGHYGCKVFPDTQEVTASDRQNNKDIDKGGSNQETGPAVTLTSKSPKTKKENRFTRFCRRLKKLFQ